jgi:hypothetical protein
MEFGIYVPPDIEPIALVLEIIREGNKELSYLNRYCQNPQTKVSLLSSPIPTCPISAKSLQFFVLRGLIVGSGVLLRSLGGS